MLSHGSNAGTKPCCTADTAIPKHAGAVPSHITDIPNIAAKKIKLKSKGLKVREAKFGLTGC